MSPFDTKARNKRLSVEILTFAHLKCSAWGLSPFSKEEMNKSVSVQILHLERLQCSAMGGCDSLTQKQGTNLFRCKYFSFGNLKSSALGLLPFDTEEGTNVFPFKFFTF